MIYTLNGERVIRTLLECNTKNGLETNLLCKQAFTDDDMDSIKDFVSTIKGVKVDSFEEFIPRPMSLEIVDEIESADWILYSKDPDEIRCACENLIEKGYDHSDYIYALERYKELGCNDKWLGLFVINTYTCNQGDVKIFFLANNLIYEEV